MGKHLSFSIDIDGLDDIKKELEKLQKGVSLDEMKMWCKTIEDRAKIDCPEEHKEHVKLDCSTRGISGEIGIHYDADSKEALTHIKNAIQMHLNSMPIMVQEYFKIILEDMEKHIKS